MSQIVKNVLSRNVEVSTRNS